MTSIQLKLEIPRKYEIYSNKLEGSSSSPLTGSLVISSHTHAEIASLNQVKIHLVRVLTEKHPKCTSGSEPLLQRFNRLIATTPKPSPPAVDKQNCSIIESLALHVPRLGPESQVGYSPENGRIYKIPFHLPIPGNIPGTARTELSDVSYCMVASTNTIDGKTLNTSCDIQLVRRITQDSPSVQHTRGYPNSSLIKKMALTQDLTVSANSGISISLEIFVPPRNPPERHTDYNCIAVRGIRWRIEELSKLLIRMDYNEQECSDMLPAEENVSTREIHSGFQKGYWRILPRPATASPSANDDDDEDWSIDILFNLDISTSEVEALAPEIDLSCYDSHFASADQLASQECRCTTTHHGMMLTVEHRVKLDILMSEDTFDVETHSMVDRKPLRTALNASFPLQIIDYAEGDYGEILDRDIPPLYEDVPNSAPDYA
ncbi:hypothetical protein N7478_011949 [Penicillium angulare]|uniref:uncharacterized protein n=1 Tax=Penicillium angulare TaxID=116970 RepID=UPI0025408D1C|nr:uncharacterized protein N7478_011949 [Penicillium angulare]KAJ5261354.1 hypothetical protein N7478_011949 [Penicillium angulare]